MPPRDDLLHEQPPERLRAAGLRRHGRHGRVQRQPALLHRQRDGDLQRHRRLRHPHRQRRRRGRRRDLRRHAWPPPATARRRPPGEARWPAPRATTAAAGPSRPVVTMASSHVTAPGGSGTCKDCHAGHFKGVRIPLPPTSWSNPNLGATNMRTQLGIAYADAGGIDLGGPGTVASINARANEAEICWGCHDDVATPVSEWGYNTKTTPAGFPVTTFVTVGRQPGIRELRLALHLLVLRHQGLRLDAGFLDVRLRLAPEAARRVGAHGELRRRRAVLERGRQRPRRTGRSSGPPRPWSTRGRSAARTATTSTTPSAPAGSPTSGAPG